MVDILRKIANNAKTGSLGNFLLRTQNTIISAAVILSLAGGINAFLGFIKGRVTATYFGDSTEVAVFFTADKIPSLIFQVLVWGSLSTIFIPIFNNLYNKNKEEAFKAASAIINTTLLVFSVISIPVFIFAKQIIGLLALGTFGPTEIALGADLLRIMLVGQIILVASTFITSILQSFRHFLATAIAPIVFNLGYIFGTLILVKSFGIYAMAYSVIIGAVLHLLLQIPFALKVDFKYIPAIKIKAGEIRELLSMLLPRIGSVFITNLIYTVNNSFALLISPSAAAHFKYATQLQFFPVQIFGVAIATAALPTLSAEGEEDNYKRFKETFLTSFHQMMFLIVPVSIILLVLRIPVVRIVYGADRFPWDATVSTAYTLAFFSVSIFAQSAVYIITRAFYALKDTQTPVKISLFTIFVNILLSLYFIRILDLGVWCIALSFSITAIMDMLLMFYALNKKVLGFDIEKIIIPMTKISMAGLLMGASIYIPMKLLDQLVFDTTKTINLLVLSGIVTLAGMTTYLIFTKLFKVTEIEMFYSILRRLKIKKTYQSFDQTLSQNLK